MAITKLPRSGIADNSINASKIEDGTVAIAEVSGTISNAKLKDGEIANAKLSNSTITIRGVSKALGTSVTIGVDVDWQSVITSNTTMVAGRGYFVNTTGGAISMTLPASASIGDFVAIKDYAGTFATNKLTILRNGHNIQGVANESLISTNRASVVLVYVDSTKGWLFTYEHNVGDLENNTFVEATGGTVLTAGDFKTHIFTGSSNFVVSGASNNASCNVAEYLVIGGGGGGGKHGTASSAVQGAGGGGAGGWRHFSAIACTSPAKGPAGITLSAQTYPITVGAGGAQSSSSGSLGVSGGNSIFSTITSTGGGGGGSQSSSPGGNGANGGSGGGGGGVPGPQGQSAGGSGNTPPVSPSQGSDGGNGSARTAAPASDSGGGGGGGASAAAPDNSVHKDDGGPAGAGQFVVDGFFGPTAPSYGQSPSPLAGNGRYFSGGGGGGSANTPGGQGQPGAGGGGIGGNKSTPHGAGTANTGGGGGGSSANNSALGTGGSGIVAIRYKFQ